MPGETMMRTVERAAGREVLLTPAPIAMVWNEPGEPHAEIAVPGLVLAPGDALVEVDLATVCASDVRTWRGVRHARSPLVLGHEQLGRVVALGDGAVRADGTPLELGDRVVWSVTAGCGACDRCVRGLPQHCRNLLEYGHERVHRGWELSGGFATHVQLRAGTAIVPIGEELPSLVAAPIACAWAGAVAAIDAVAERVEPFGTTILVYGAGMFGLATTALLDDRGARVVVVEPDAGRRARAVDFGAAAVADPSAPAGHDDSLPAVLAGLRADGCAKPLAAIETSGRAAAIASALDELAIGGTAVLAGGDASDHTARIDPEAIAGRLLAVQGSRGSTPAQLREAVAAARRLAWTRPFDELVGATFALAELDRALEVAASGEHVRVGIAPKRRARAS